MSVIVEWDHEEAAVVRQTFTGKWTWNELYTSLQEVDRLIRSVDHPVFLLIDMRKSMVLPSGALAHVRTLDRWHPNLQKIIAIGVNPLIRTMFGVVARVRPSMHEQIILVITLEDAFAVMNVLKRQVYRSDSVDPAKSLVDTSELDAE